MSQSHPFSTRRGRKVRQSYRRAHPLCEPCKRKRLVADTEEVHHIVRVADGGAPFDWANLESRCGRLS
jgi:hypothetical protein